MRVGTLIVALGLATVARGEEPTPVVIAPFRPRCFDAARLAERVRARLPGAPVSVGTASPGDRQVVRVEEAGATVTVEVTSQAADGRVAGSERRRLPADEECDVLVETAALIVARAATPLA